MRKSETACAVGHESIAALDINEWHCSDKEVFMTAEDRAIKDCTNKWEWKRGDGFKIRSG